MNQKELKEAIKSTELSITHWWGDIVQPLKNKISPDEGSHMSSNCPLCVVYYIRSGCHICPLADFDKPCGSNMDSTWNQYAEAPNLFNAQNMVSVLVKLRISLQSKLRRLRNSA